MPVTVRVRNAPRNVEVGIAAQALRTRAQALNLAAGTLGGAFATFAGALGAVQGRIIVAGAGMNDCTARYTAQAFSCSGIPSLFAGTEFFGGSGLAWVFSPGDALLVFSGGDDGAFWEEVIFATSRREIPLFVIGPPGSKAGRETPHVLEFSDTLPSPAGETERSPLVPMALGDALARAISRFRGVEASAVYEAKVLGWGRFRHVSEIMRKGSDLPLLGKEATLAQARALLRKHAPCAVGIVKRGRLSGVISDADFRRMGSRVDLEAPVTKAMRVPAAALGEDDSVAEALRLLRKSGAAALFVLRERQPVGLVGPYDCLKA